MLKKSKLDDFLKSDWPLELRTRATATEKLAAPNDETLAEPSTDAVQRRIQ